MNEHTYKAKKLEDGEWTQGSLFAGLNHNLIMQGINLKEMKVNGNEVDKDTICRYACNGLWEHDIIVNETEVGVIRYGIHEKSFGFYVDWKSPSAKAMNHKCVVTWMHDDGETRVVGNEIDNPELAEQIVEEIKRCLNEKR